MNCAHQMVFLPPPPPPNPPQSRLGLVPRWCSGEGEAVSELGASWGSLQRCPSVSAPVWLWVPPLWWHGCKTLWQQIHQNKSIQSHVQYSTILFSPQPYSLIFAFFFHISLQLLLAFDLTGLNLLHLKVVTATCSVSPQTLFSHRIISWIQTCHTFTYLHLLIYCIQPLHSHCMDSIYVTLKVTPSAEKLPKHLLLCTIAASL